MSVQHLGLYQSPAKRQPRIIPAWGKKALQYLGLGILPVVFTAIPTLGAEQILISYGPLEFSLSISALETYAETGTINHELAFYAKRLKEQDLATFRQALLYREDVNPFTLSQFLYSSMGETTLRNLGQIVETGARQNGFYALRAALILAAVDSEGLTLLNVMRYYPTKSIRINLSRILALMKT
jgi:hypothetical protein